MTSVEPSGHPLARGAGVLSASIGVGLLLLVAVLVRVFRRGPVTWALLAVLLLLSVKGCFALIRGVRLVLNRQGPVIRPVEWTAMGVGYGAICIFLIVAALAGEGWAYVFAAAVFGGLAPVWFLVGRRSGKSLTESKAATHSNPAAAGDRGSQRPW